MIDFRYHLVSLISVFLALAVGVLALRRAVPRRLGLLAAAVLVFG